MSIDPKKRLQDLLVALFQLDKTDLDFGIYRIMNLRAADVHHFIDEILPARLNEATSKLSSRSIEDKREAIEAAKEGLLALSKALGKQIKTEEEMADFCRSNPDAEAVKVYQSARESASQAPNTEDLERDIYNDLFRFFDRYYEGGDFVSKPRAGESTFMIPYNGEETKFYWANYDQYYIKTGENFKNYVFTNGETDSQRRTTVEFRLVEAEIEVNNNQNKKGRVFLPTEDYFAWSDEERKLTLKFYYKVPSKEEKETWGDKQSVKADNKGINEKLVLTQLDSRIRETGDAFLIRFWEKEREVKSGKKPEKQNEFYYHLNRYTSINSFDYFIHKDLRKFLRQELDYFIKNEIFSLSFLADTWSDEQTQKAIQQNVVRASVIRDIAVQVIDFLAEIENFQRRFFEKKKFVVQSDYCITLDLIPEDVFDEVINFVLSDPEQRQIKEWLKLGFIETSKVTDEDLKSDGYLVLDTQYLSAALKFKLLSGLENIDEKTDGLLIDSDNWQALNFLSEKYTGKIKCIYIDPPYNAKSSEIIYKNQFKHSSWISMIENRLNVSRKFLTKDGISVIAIDENEQENLGHLLSRVFPDDKKTCVTVIHNPGGIQGVNFSYCHEYAYFVFPNDGKQYIGKVERDEADIIPLRDWGGDESKRETAKNCFYPIYVMGDEVTGFGEVCPDDFHPDKAVIENDDGSFTIYPVDLQGVERKWRFARQSVEKIKDELFCEEVNGEKVIRRSKSIYRFKTVWTNNKYNSNAYGAKLLGNILPKNGFSFPKSVFTVQDSILATTQDVDRAVILDYYGGSGTTAHAVIKLNGDPNVKGDRKFILVEMGEYFESITKPRIQKVIYSAEWKKGKPVRHNRHVPEGRYRSNGVSHIFQYLKLEQYEDTLNNIEFDKSSEEVVPAFEFAERIRYLLSYGTNGSSSLLAIDRLARPFDYEMEIIRLNERVPTRIDLVTTFNFLLGIDVVRHRATEHQRRNYHIIEGIKKKQAYLIVWRDFDDELDLEKERDFIKHGEWFDKDALIYSNADNAFGAHSIEAEFKRLMFEDVTLD